MKTYYKEWMIAHLVLLAVYIIWLVVLVCMGRYDDYSISLILVAQALSSIGLWLLIKTRRFLMAYYFSFIVLMLAAFNFYTMGMKDYSFMPSLMNNIYQYLVYVGTALLVLFLYMLLSDYPRRVLKTAKKMNL